MPAGAWRLLLSKTAVSQLGERLWEDYQAFAQRDLSEYQIAYLFVDGIAERLRPGAKREPVLAAWGFTADARRVLLHLMAGSKEDAETVTAFFEDMKGRGLNDPLLVLLAHRQRIIVFDLRRKVPVAVEFQRKGLASNQFSGERFTRWSSVTASSFPFPSRTVEWLIYHSTVHRF